MTLKIVIRKETKNDWEGRAPLIPEAVRKLVAQGIPIHVEQSSKRVFDDESYRSAGAVLVEKVVDAILVIGIKEPDQDAVKPGQIHMAFSHTIKGQTYNMPLLQTFLERKATLIDYETIKDDKGRRLIAFGRFAGIAGAVDTFHVAGQKLAMNGRETSFARIKQSYHYQTIERLRAAMMEVRPSQREELKILIVGTGNVGLGAIEVCEWLGLTRIDAKQLREKASAPGTWFCVLGTEDIVRAKNGEPYDRATYRTYGSQRFESCFSDYLGKFNILLQTPYWEEKYPRQLTHEQALRYRDQLPLAIGDISCDIEGSLACTLKASTIDKPAYTYDPERRSIIEGIAWDGPTVMAIDHLPCELSVDSSEHFSNALSRYVPELSALDLSLPFDQCGLSRALRDATIVYQGELTPGYRYLERYLKN